MAVAVIVFGPRSTFGLFVEPIDAARGWGREVFALAMALQQLVWGALQPIGGFFADRFGAIRAITVGALLYSVGMILMTMVQSPLGLHLSAGVLIGAGLAGAGLPIVVAAVAQKVSAERRSLALGLVTAGSSLGQFAFAPLSQWYIGQFGWVLALALMAIPVLCLPLIALPLRGAASSSTEDVAPIPIGKLLRGALSVRSYQLLIAGFFVCGFHVSFITLHLPPYLHDMGVAASLAAIALSVIGLFNVIGAVVAGVLGQRFSKRYVLSCLYIARAIIITIFLIAEKNTSSVILFAAGMGLLWLSTVPLTSGLVAVMFGTRNLGTLFGLVFFSHQVGAFIGIWLGGYLYASQGSYFWTWVIAIILSLTAAVIHLPIEEKPATLAGSPVPVN